MVTLIAFFIDKPYTQFVGKNPRRILERWRRFSYQHYAGLVDKKTNVQPEYHQPDHVAIDHMNDHTSQSILSEQDDATRGAFWLRQAERVQRKMNLAWWLQLFLPSFCALSLAFACLQAVLRHAFIQSGYVWAGYAIALCICVLVCLRLAKKHFLTTRDSAGAARCGHALAQPPQLRIRRGRNVAAGHREP